MDAREHDREKCAQVAQKLDGGWRYYYAEVSPGVFCVFNTETLDPVKYLNDVPAARFWVAQYESGTEVPE